MNTAIVYDWLTACGGGERTLDAIAEAYPSPIYTLVHNPDAVSDVLKNCSAVHSSFIQNLPFAKSAYRYYLPLFPLAIEQFDLRSHDLVLSVSHAVAKGVLTHAHQLHLCYCFTPMRYAWDLTHQYLDSIKGARKLLAKFSLHRLRNWDIASLNRVDHFATLSHYIAKRIKKVYGREATVIYPPVEVGQIALNPYKEEFYLTASRCVPYKRMDLIVEAFSHFPNKRLVVIGDGPQMPLLKKKAGKNVELMGWQPESVLRDLMGRAKGFIFAAEEDFGIVVVEAQAAGTPVIAFGKGAALETVLDQQTGLFFQEQTVASLCNAILEFETKTFDPQRARHQAERFNRERFIQEFRQFVTEKHEAFNEIHYFGRRERY